MRSFDYRRAGAIDDALAALTSTRTGRVRPLAGGTDLLPLMKADIVAPEVLIDIKRAAGLDERIDETPDGGLRLGALATLHAVAGHPLVRGRYRALAEAAAIAASPQLRQMATIGGNLLQRPRCWYFRDRHVDCWLKGGAECPARDGQNREHALFSDNPCVAVHPSDPANALVACDAAVRLRGPSGERLLPLAAFFAQPTLARRTETTLARDELVVAVELPPSERRSTYLKAMDRKVWAFALVSVAAGLRLEGGRITEARLVLGGVANIPWRVPAAEAALIGAELSQETITRAARLALGGAEPLAHNAYKLQLAEALVRRALAALAD